MGLWAPAGAPSVVVVAVVAVAVDPAAVLVYCYGHGACDARGDDHGDDCGASYL